MALKLPYWSRDPFSHLTQDEKRRIKAGCIERILVFLSKNLHTESGEIELK